MQRRAIVALAVVGLLRLGGYRWSSLPTRDDRGLGNGGEDANDTCEVLAYTKLDGRTLQVQAVLFPSPPTSIVDLFALCRGARLMVSGDTGPLHIAAAVGTPVVALFGPTDPDRNGPWRREDVTVSRCAQCACHYQRACRFEVPCITTIELEEVVDAVARRLQE